MNKKERFKKTKDLLNINAPKGKATAEVEASKNPMEYLKKNKNPSWKHLKGIAF